MGEIRSLSSDGQLQGCGVPKSMSKSLSKQILCLEKPEKVDKEYLRVGLPPPELFKQQRPPVLTTTTSIMLSIPDCQTDVELENTNRNNSAEAKMVVSAVSTKWTKVAREPSPPGGSSRHYMTVPAGGVRVNRRHSLNMDSYKECCYFSLVQQQQPKPGGGVRSKRSLSMSGELPQLESAMANIRRSRDKLYGSEWLLESTL